MLGSVLGSIAGAVGGKVGSGMIDGFMNEFFNKRQENRAFDRNIAMWNMENQYNSPKEQMKRYKDAGLNPNLVYNSLGGSTNIGSVGMADNSVNASNSNYANPYFHYMNIKNRQYEDAVKNQQLIKMEKDNELLAEKILTERAKRNPPKTVANNQGGDNLLKGKNLGLSLSIPSIGRVGLSIPQNVLQGGVGSVYNFIKDKAKYLDPRHIINSSVAWLASKKIIKNRLGNDNKTLFDKKTGSVL